MQRFSSCWKHSIPISLEPQSCWTVCVLTGAKETWQVLLPVRHSKMPPLPVRPVSARWVRPETVAATITLPTLHRLIRYPRLLEGRVSGVKGYQLTVCLGECQVQRPFAATVATGRDRRRHHHCRDDRVSIYTYIYFNRNLFWVTNHLVLLGHTSTLKRRKALYDFEGESIDELSFRAGDVITVIEEVDEGWWLGEVEHFGPKRRGIFPVNYTEDLINGASPPVPARPPTSIMEQPVEEEHQDSPFHDNQATLEPPRSQSTQFVPLATKPTTSRTPPPPPASSSRVTPALSTSASTRMPMPPPTSAIANTAAADAPPCQECGCNDFSANVFKKGHCKTCFHYHSWTEGMHWWFRYKEKKKKKKRARADYKICYRTKDFAREGRKETFLIGGCRRRRWSWKISIWEYASPGTAVRIGKVEVVGVIVIDGSKIVVAVVTSMQVEWDIWLYGSCDQVALTG